MTDQRYPHARFWKCALQVNPPSYGKRYRGQEHELDAEAYVEELREVCRRQDIKVVGLADHGSVQDVDRIRNALSRDDIVVFPGFEIASTEKIHMVCLFAEDTKTEKLQRVLGRLDLMDPEERVKPSQPWLPGNRRDCAGTGWILVCGPYDRQKKRSPSARSGGRRQSGPRLEES